MQAGRLTKSHPSRNPAVCRSHLLAEAPIAFLTNREAKRSALAALTRNRVLPNPYDLAAFALLAALAVLALHGAAAMRAPLSGLATEPVVLDPALLPDYALRTTTRMFAAIIASLAFTFTIATLAAKSRRAEMVIVPALDILQSVPVLGFLTFTVAFFMGLFPGSQLGAECASIFAIFTSQAWNMAFSFYQSLRTVPRDLDEVSRSFGLSSWQRFWRLEAPFAMPGLVWNTMMSMSGGWFFVVASEAITVGDTTVQLPGLGSWLALAIKQQDFTDVAWAGLAMAIVIGVGLARALVVHPKVLLMDEPFSALDVLTAETLRTDLLYLWREGRMPIEAILMVTHNIEEAVLMCDRILIFGSNPGRVIAELKVELPQPRNRLDPAFRTLVEDIYARMTAKAGAPARDGFFPGTGIAMALPRVSTNLMAGLIETIAGAAYRGEADLPPLAAELHLEIDDLFPVAETLQLLRFADLEGGDIRLTAAGLRFADADVDGRKRLFAQQLAAYVPLAAHIRRVLDERSSHRAPAPRFRDELEDHMSEDYAATTLKAVTNWARYGEYFAYDEDADLFTLDNPS